MKVSHVLLLAALVYHGCVSSVSANTASATEVVPAITGIVSPAFFEYASEVAVKVCTRFVCMQLCLILYASVWGANTLLYTVQRRY